MNGGDERREDELVERLIRLAGEEPAVPAFGVERVRRAVRPLWQEEVRRRKRRRVFGWVAATLGAAASLALVATNLWRGAASPGPQVGRVELVRGRFTEPGTLDRAGGAGTVVRQNQTIRTGPEDRAVLHLVTGTWVRLDVDTTLHVRSSELLALDQGAVYVETGTGDPVEIRTPFGAVRHVGTRFIVDHRGASTEVLVREGSVFVVAGGETILAEAGRKVTVDAAGSIRTTEVEPHGERWAWVLLVSPAFEIEGRTVAAFLDWVERETGRRIEYDDAATEQAAREAVLHGALGDLRADVAPEVILPTAGLEAEPEGGVLRVRRLGAPD